MQPDERRFSHPAAWAVLAALGAVLLLPALTPEHVEGFSASIVSLGLHIAAGDVQAYDRLFPVNLEFFGLSRLGTSLSVAFFARVFGMSGELAMRTTMWVGLVTLAIASWSLVRRWTGASGLVVAAALLVLPGVAETSFFYNDNVFSSAFAAGGLAVLAGSRRPLVTLLAGLLLGAAVVTRADAILLGPAVPLILFEQMRVRDGMRTSAFDRRAFAVRGGLLAIGALVPIVGAFAAFHATFLDVLHISRYVVAIWARGHNVRTHAIEVAYFFGLPGLVLALVGLYGLVARRDITHLLLLAGVPFVFNLVNFGTLWQARQLLPLTPFVAALVVLGWQQIAPAEATVWTRALRPAMALLTIVVLVAPIRWLVSVDDGPRALRGRVWNVGRWRRWQEAVASDMVGIRRIVTDASANGSPAVIVTDSWNDDRYVHLALQEAGYDVVPSDRIAPSCAKVTELFQRRDRHVLHVRLHVPFLQHWRAAPLEPPRVASYGLPCLTAAHATDLILLGATAPLKLVWPNVTDPTRRAMESRADSVFRSAGYDITIPVHLATDSLARYVARSVQVTMSMAPPSASRVRSMTLVEVERLLAQQVPFFR